MNQPTQKDLRTLAGKTVRFALLAAICFGFVLPNAVAQQEPIYMRSHCITVEPGHAAELRQLVEDVSLKLAEQAIKDGDLRSFGFSRSVIPSGEEATCNYVLAQTFAGFPKQGSRAGTEALYEKLKIPMSYDAFLQRFLNIARVKTTAIWLMRTWAGGISSGDFFQIDYMKTAPGKMGDWIKMEAEWQRIHDLRISDGGLKGWGAYSKVLPGGSGQEFDAMTLNIYPSWDTMGKPVQYPKYFKQVFPDNAQEIVDNTNAVREIVNVELYQMILSASTPQ